VQFTFTAEIASYSETFVILLFAESLANRFRCLSGPPPIYPVGIGDYKAPPVNQRERILDLGSGHSVPVEESVDDFTASYIRKSFECP
jgi:hypothetical protein